MSVVEQYGFRPRCGVVIGGCDELDVDFIGRAVDAYCLKGDETRSNAVAVSDLRRREVDGVIDELRFAFVDCLLGVVMYDASPFWKNVGARYSVPLVVSCKQVANGVGL